MPSSLHKLGVQLESRDDTANVFLTCLGDEISYYDGERQGAVIIFNEDWIIHNKRRLPTLKFDEMSMCERTPGFVIFITPDSSRDDWTYYLLFDDANGPSWCKICFQTKKLNFTTSPCRCNKRYTTFRPYPAHLQSSYIFRVTVSKGAPTSYK